MKVESNIRCNHLLFYSRQDPQSDLNM